MIRLVQIALPLTIVIPFGMAQAQVESIRPALDGFTNCVVAAFVDFEIGNANADPERAFLRCATEEQRMLAVISFIRTDSIRRIAYAKFLQKKSELKTEMLRMSR